MRGSNLWKHGDTGSPEHRTWLSMINRCYYAHANAHAYTNYGGKGIRVCRRWRTSYVNFLHDMGRKPSPAHTIERRNSKKNYTPANCYWATRAEQNRNRSQCWRIRLAGQTLTVAEWARLLGVSDKRIYVRLYRGWTRHEAVLLPMSQRLRRPAHDRATIRHALTLLRERAFSKLRRRLTPHWRTFRQAGTKVLP